MLLLTLALCFYRCVVSPEPIVLDITSTINPSAFEKTNGNFEGIPCVYYHTLENFHTFKVVEDHNLLWRRRAAEEVCTEARVYLHNGKPFLTELTIENDGTESTVYVMRRVGTWSTVTRKEFDESITHEKATLGIGKQGLDGFMSKNTSVLALFCIMLALTFHIIAH